MLQLTTWEPSAYALGDHSITFEVKRLGFVEAKAFQVHANRMRFDVLMAQGAIIEAMQREERQARRDHLVAALAIAGIAPPTMDEARAGWVERHAAAVAANPEDAALAALTVEQVDADDLFVLEAGQRLKAAGIAAPELSLADTAALVARQEPHLVAANEKYAEFSASIGDDWVAQVFTDYVRHVQGIAVDGVPVTTGSGLLAVGDDNLVLYVLRRVKELSNLSTHAKKISSLPRTSAQAARTSGAFATVAPVASEDSPPRATVTVIPDATGSCSPLEEAPASVPVSS
jgi:hypothetical protein